MAVRLQMAQLVGLDYAVHSSKFVISAVVAECSGTGEIIVRPSANGAARAALVPSQKVQLSLCDSAGLHQTEAVVTRIVSESEGTIGVKLLSEFRTTQNRSFFRVYTRLPCPYQVVQSQRPDTIHQEDSEAFSQDISAGGVRLCTVRDLRSGDRIRLSVACPGRDEPPGLVKSRRSSSSMGKVLVLDAEVLRAEPCAGARRECYVVSARFLELSASEQDRLVAFMFDLQRRCKS